MSCRVIKREMEVAMLDALVNVCRDRNISKIVGRYIPTAKNSMVESLYSSLGFSQLDEVDGVTSWSLNVEDYEQPDLKMRIENDAG